MRERKKAPRNVSHQIYLTYALIYDRWKSFAPSETWILVSNYCIRCVWLSHLFICTFQLEITSFPSASNQNVQWSLILLQFTSFNFVVIPAIHCCILFAALILPAAFDRIQCKGHGKHGLCKKKRTEYALWMLLCSFNKMSYFWNSISRRFIRISILAGIQSRVEGIYT